MDGVCQFSQRGGIIDFYPPHMPDPFRLEFWGDEIDSIAVFKTDTQRREDNCKRCMITPAREVLYLSLIHIFAPVSAGAGSVIAAGTTVTEDVPDDALAVGRARQETRPGWAREKGKYRR